MPTEQEKERRRQQILLARERRVSQEGQRSVGEVSPFLGSLGKAALTAVDYPRHGVAEYLQMLGEQGEAYRERGLGGLAAHTGRELGSTALDIAADVTGGLLPESWGERLDPSQQTEMGMDLETQKESFRTAMGRDPSMVELYDMKAGIQDEAMPWLTERHKIGPLEFSNRALLEAGGEAAVAAGEIALTGGAATAGRFAIRKGAQKGAEIIAKGVGKSTTRRVAAQAAGRSLIAGTRGIGEIFKTPFYVDKLFGAVIGRPLAFGVRTGFKTIGLGFKTIGLPLRAGMWAAGPITRPVAKEWRGGLPATRGAVKMLINVFRRNAASKGVPVQNMNEAAQKGMQDFAPGQQLSFNDLYESGIDNPQPRIGADGEPQGFHGGPHPTFNVESFDWKPKNNFERRWINNLVQSGGYDEKASSWKALAEEGKTLGYTKNEMLAMQTTAGPATKPANTGNAIFDGFKNPENTVPGDEVLNNVSTSWMGIKRDTVRSILFQADQTRKRILGKVPLIRGHIDRYQDIPEHEKQYAITAREVGDGVQLVLDLWTTQKESLKALAETKIAYYIKGLEDTGMLVWNVGGPGGRFVPVVTEGNEAAVADALEAMGVVLKSGNNAEDLLRLDKAKELQTHGNHNVIMPDPEDFSLRGHTRIEWDESKVGGRPASKPRYYLDEKGNAAGKTEKVMRLDADLNPVVKQTDARGVVSYEEHYVALNLDPTIGDIIEQIGLYRPALKSVKTVVQRLDSQGNKIAGDYMTAYDLFVGMAKAGRDLEDALRLTGSPLPGSAHAVTAGGSYVPRNALKGLIADGILPNPNDRIGELALELDKAGKILPVTHGKERQFASQAEGQWAGHWYANPAAALGDYADFVSEHIMAYKQGRFITNVAERKGIPHATTKRMLADDATNKAEAYMDNIANQLKQVMNRLKKQGQLPTALNKEATAIMRKVRHMQKIVDKFKPTDDGEITAKMREELEQVMPLLAEWQKSYKGLAGKLRATRAEKRRITNALNRAKAAYDQYKKIHDEDLKSIAGVGIESLYFPKVFADAMLKTDIARSQMEKNTWFLNSLNSWLRIAGATGDMSALGIQGWTALLNDAFDAMDAPGGRQLDKATGLFTAKADRKYPSMAALAASWKAFRHSGPEIIGEYMFRKEQIAAQTGRLGPTGWANNGLAVLANAPDLYVSKSGLRHIPGIKNVDASFTHYGNVLRMELAEMELDAAMLTYGKTVDQLIADGTVAEISKVVNFMSGVGRRGMMGDVGQFLIFAPRFLHARLKMVSLATRGMLPGARPLQQRIAASYMSRAFGTATYLTLVINEAMGETTDINPIAYNPQTKKLMWNSNFLRIHAGPLDISLLGPWDGMLRLMALGPLTAVNVGLTGKKNFKDLRTAISAPGTGMTLDMIAGQDAIGRRTKPAGGWGSLYGDIGATAGWAGRALLENAVPFAWGDVFFGEQPGQPSVMGRFWSGRKKLGTEPLQGAGEMAAATGQTIGQWFGVKSSYESVTETLNESFADILENMTEEQKLVAFGIISDMPGMATMTEEEMRNAWAQGGKEWWKRMINVEEDWGIHIGFRGGLGEPLPKWTQLAHDVQNNIKEMIRSGAFAEIMTAEEMIDLEQRLITRMEQSGGDYAALNLERIGIDTLTKGYLDDSEEAYLDAIGDPDQLTITWDIYDAEAGKWVKETTEMRYDDLGLYLKHVRNLLGYASAQRRDLVDPGDGPDKLGRGRYAGVTEALFPKGTRSYSNADFDIYDAVSEMYLEDLYNQTNRENEKDSDGNAVILGSIVIGGTGVLDWDTKDKKIEDMHIKLKKQFADLSDERITRFIWRVENSMVKDVPPVAGLLIQMQTFISRAKMALGETYYDTDKQAIEALVTFNKKEGATPEKDQELRDDITKRYRAYQVSGSDTRKQVLVDAETAGISGLRTISNQRQNALDRYFSMLDSEAIQMTGAARQAELHRRGHIESLLVLLDKRYSTDPLTTIANAPKTPRGQMVASIWHNHRTGLKVIENLPRFLMDVYDIEATDVHLRREYGMNGR
jgi:hypothetical protein